MQTLKRVDKRTGETLKIYNKIFLIQINTNAIQDTIEYNVQIDMK